MSKHRGCDGCESRCSNCGKEICLNNEKYTVSKDGCVYCEKCTKKLFDDVKDAVQDALTKQGYPIYDVVRGPPATLGRRERVASLALAGLMARHERWTPELTASESIRYADALLAELEKDNERK